MKRSLILLFLACLAATAIVGIAAISSGDFDETTARILVTTAAASFYSLVGLTCVAQLGKRGETFGKAGLLFCALGLLHAIYTTWINFDGFEVIQNRLALVIAGMAIGHACLMLLISPRNGAVSALMFVAIASVVLNSVFSIASLYSGSFASITLLGIVGIIATCTTIAAPALNLVSAK